MQSAQRHNAIVRLPPKAEKGVLLFIGMLSSTILLKLASVQYLEFLELALLAYVAFRFLRTNLRVQLSRGLFRLAVGYAGLIFLILVGCGLAFTRPFYLYTEGLNSPGLVTLSRVLELILGVFGTIILTEVFQRSQTKCLFTAKAYFWTGTASAALSLIGFVVRGPFNVFLAEKRASGFYNEGGPYGLYVLSVVLVGWALTRIPGQPRRVFFTVAILIDAAGLLLSASKAAYIAVALFLILQVFAAGGWRQKAVSFGITVVTLGAILALTPLSKGINGYIEGGRRFEAISQVRPNDINFSYGRVAALFFVPRMVAEHPWMGVGFANYGLVRNAPEYRGNAAIATFVDHDGLGLFGLTAELGLPATFLLVYLLLQPAMLSRRLTDVKPILALSLMQPIAHLCGAQLNVTYPWIASALAIGMAKMQESHSRQVSEVEIETSSREAKAPLAVFPTLNPLI